MSMKKDSSRTTAPEVTRDFSQRAAADNQARLGEQFVERFRNLYGPRALTAEVLPATDNTLFDDLLRVLSILFKYRWLILAVTLAAAFCVIAFCIASVLLPPGRSPLPDQYLASAIILVQHGPEDELSSSIRSAFGYSSGLSDPSARFDRSALLLMVLQSPGVLDELAQRFDVAKKYKIHDHVVSRSRRILLSKLRFKNDPAAGAITISCEDTDPVFAKNVANGLVSILSEWFSHTMAGSNQLQRRLLQQKIADVKADINRLGARQNELQTKYGVQTAQDLAASQASSLAALRSRLILNEIGMTNTSGSNTGDSGQGRPTTEGQNDPGLAKTAEGALTPDGTVDAQSQLNNLAVELEVQRQVYNTLSHQSEVLTLAPDSKPPFQVMDLAETPDAKSGPQRSRIVAEVIAIAFFASVLLALFLDRAKATLRKNEDRGFAGIPLMSVPAPTPGGLLPAPTAAQSPSHSIDSPPRTAAGDTASRTDAGSDPRGTGFDDEPDDAVT